MPSTKPSILFDFRSGRLAERLTREAAMALEDNGMALRKFHMELRSYLKAKPVVEAQPKRVLEIVSRYVDVIPIDYRAMERHVGKAARDLIPNHRYVPNVYWMLLDKLEWENPELHQRMYDYAGLLIGTREDDNSASWFRVLSRMLKKSDNTLETTYAWGRQHRWNRTGRHNARRPIPA